MTPAGPVSESQAVPEEQAAPPSALAGASTRAPGTPVSDPGGPGVAGDAMGPPKLGRVRGALYLGVIALTALFSYLALRDVDFAKVGRALTHSDYWWILPAFAVFALSTLARALRWHALFAPERRPPLSAVGNAMMVGYLFNNIFPARAGEAARVVTLRQRAGTSAVEAVGTVVVERVFDVLSILLIFFAAAPWLPHVSWFGTAAVAAIVLAAALVAVVTILVIYGDRPVRFVARPLGRLPLLNAERLERAAGDLVHGLSGLHRPSVALLGFFWSLTAWVLSAVSAWLVTYAFGFHLGLDAGLLTAVAIGLSMILPAPPASLGVFEAAALLALNAYGIGKTQALPYALMLHVINFIPFVLIGGFLLHANALHLRRGGRRVADAVGVPPPSPPAAGPAAP